MATTRRTSSSRSESWICQWHLAQNGPDMHEFLLRAAGAASWTSAVPCLKIRYSRYSHVYPQVMAVFIGWWAIRFLGYPMKKTNADGVSVHTWCHNVSLLKFPSVCRDTLWALGLIRTAVSISRIFSRAANRVWSSRTLKWTLDGWKGHEWSGVMSWSSKLSHRASTCLYQWKSRLKIWSIELSVADVWLSWPCLKLWAFPGSYRVVLEGDNFVFEERHGDGRDVRGILLQEDAWLVAPQLQWLLHHRVSLWPQKWGSSPILAWMPLIQTSVMTSYIMLYIYI